MSERISRQVFLRRAAAGGSILTVPGLLAACGGGGSSPGTSGGDTVAHQLAKTLHFSNWTLYIDKKGNTHPTLDQFHNKYHVHVDYREDINDNASFFSKIEPNRSVSLLGHVVLRRRYLASFAHSKFP
jgi:spermidine/putrescine transport system substrate-binding protein